MSDDERSELERLKQRHARLEAELSLLATQLQVLEQRLDAPSPAPKAGIRPQTPAPSPPPRPEPPRPPPQPAAVAPPPVPPVIQPLPTQVSAGAAAAPSSRALRGLAATPLTSTVRQQAPTAAATAPELPAEELRPAPPAPPASRSFEMRLGTYWLVRIGIVMLLTGLVFFGNLAYQHYISKLGPGGKVTLLYLASAMLLGAGTWWQRKAASDSLKNYAQVLFAGGLAAVYFTTYAAYYNEHLKIIQSQVWDGVLLLAWAGFMVWVADRKKSEILALFGVCLAYYTSVITRVGYFTLWSNAVLAAAAVIFLVRHRWAGLTLASLAATYAAYAFWRFYNGSEWRWATPEEGLWGGAAFLMGYWVIFTAAVFLSKHEKLAGENRAGFLTLNNGAFFALFLLTMLQVQHGEFWKFACSYGTVLLVCAEAARRALAAELVTRNSYLSQGLLLATIGIISHPKLAGFQLALVLAAESVVLLMVGQLRKNFVLLLGAYVTAALAVGWGTDGLLEHDRHGLILGMALGALMLWNTLVVDRRAAPAPGLLLRAGPGYFAVLALWVWLAVTYDNTARANFPLVLAAEAALLTLSIYLLRVREFTVLGQGYLVLAQLAWMFHFVVANQQPPPWWNPVLLIAITLGISHWWQKQKLLQLGSPVGLGCQWIYALAMVGVLYFWLQPRFAPPNWLAVTGLLAVGLTAYGVLTRAWFLAACAQIFMGLSVGQYALQLWAGKPGWPLALVPIVALVGLSFGTVGWFARRPAARAEVRTPLLQLAATYRWVALAMSLWWVWEYIPARERIWVYALLGLAVFVVAGWQRSREALVFAGAFTLAGQFLFALNGLGLISHLHQEIQVVYWPNLLAILALLAQQRLAQRRPERYAVDASGHALLIVLGSLCLWLLLTCWVLEDAGGFYLTASWSAFALVLFTVGIVLRERVYRWLGLGVLACALARVVLIDVWKLKELYRILSFVALGIALLVLGFVYNKYQEKIKEWL